MNWLPKFSAYHLPVFSVVELLAYGLGSMDVARWLGKHLIDPLPLFQKKRFNV
jgi:hypothetical protein